MEEHAYSGYCSDKYWQRCADENLEVVKVLDERFDGDGTLEHKDTIRRCRVCGGFYKQQYRAIYNHSWVFDAEEGWEITDNYFRIEEPCWKAFNSTLAVPLTIREAREYGYTGEDRSWKNGRCNFPAQNVELTCRAGDLEFVADVTPAAWDHLKNKLYKCRRCGEWYLYTALPPNPQGLFKASNELFPHAVARLYGYGEDPKVKSAASAPVDFDALARKARQTGAAEDLKALSDAVFALPEWVFIARGEVPNLYPYSAPNALDGLPMVATFTDVERAKRFAGEYDLLEDDGTCVTLHIPTATVVKNLKGRAAGGVWFNCEAQSNGFFMPIEGLDQIDEPPAHASSVRRQPVKTLRIIVQEALVLTPEMVRDTNYKVNFFCRVPADWLENGRLKAEHWQKIADRIFGENWSAEIFPGARYIIKSSETEIFDDDAVKNRNWRDIVDPDDLFYFFIGSENGAVEKVEVGEFQADIDAALK
jgi:hypothetical protein